MGMDGALVGAANDAKNYFCTEECAKNKAILSDRKIVERVAFPRVAVKHPSWP